MLYASMVVCYMLALGIGVCRHRALLGGGIRVCSKGAWGMLGVSILVIWTTYLRRFHMLCGSIGVCSKGALGYAICLHGA